MSNMHHIYIYISISILSLGSQVQVVCSMENCDVSPSTLTGCVGGPRATAMASLWPWPSTTGHRRFHDHHGPPIDFLDSPNLIHGFFSKPQVRLQTCTVPEADPSLDLIQQTCYPSVDMEKMAVKWPLDGF